MTKPATINREAWLGGWLDRLRPIFKSAGFDLPAKTRVTCGFPSRGGLANKGKTLGECWPASRSAGKFHELLISPTLDEDDEVAQVVAHEAAHACMEPKVGHKAPWRKAAQAVGIVEPGPSKGVLGPALKSLLAEFVKTAGHYPHQRLHGELCGKPKQGTRMLKCVCPKCGYTCRTTQKWLDIGAPVCPQDKVSMPCQGGGEGDGDSGEEPGEDD